MREIKFRAWDYNNECIIPWEKITLEKDEGENTFSVVVFDGAVGDHFDDFPYMQYTGLKDKHGDEIYEGDIVLRNGFEYEINFEIGSFMLVGHDVDMYREFVNCWNDNVYPLSQLYWENGDDENWISDLEVIGNKYEGKLKGDD